jgi:hypothetical protein
MKLRNLSLAVAATAVLAGCSDESLGVPNLNNPDVARSLSTPDGIEAILKNGFVQVFGATHGTTGALWPQALILGFENFGTVANNGMALRSTIPRIPVDNQRGNQTASENNRDFSQLSLRGRQVANAITALNTLVEEGGSLGSAQANARALSFGYFALGMANAEMAMMYDSVGVVTPLLTGQDVPTLSYYPAAMDTALMQLDSSLAYATQATGAALPNDWLRVPEADVPMSRFVRIVRSHKARFRAGVARTPEERAAVNWAAVEADAAAGITENFTLALDDNEGWDAAWVDQMSVFQGWHAMPNFIMGMADTTSGYATWLGTPLSGRTPFLIVTPDQRFPQGTTRAAQVANSPDDDAVLPDTYFRNRDPGDDTPGQPYGDSFYDLVRFRHYNQQDAQGPWHWMTKAENDMLRAEALIRLGRAADAVPLINATRVENGLPPFPAGSTAETRAPAQPGGGPNSCVPRTPTGPGNALECGTLFEAMKWEKRMETAWTGYAQWFIDARGWGDLAEGTTYMWPVPYQEMDARRQAFYNSPWQSTAGTYGF